MTTSRSRIWNLVQSWWILLTLTLFFNWLAFLYLGVRARQVKWLLAGVLYFAAVAQYFVVDGAIANHGTIFGASIILVFVADGVSVVHAFLVRKEYLARLEMLQHLQPYEDLERRERIAEQYTSHTDKQRAAQKLAQCDALILDIEHESVALDLLPATSPVRAAYAAALQSRAAGEQLLDRATSPDQYREADQKLTHALTDLQHVAARLQ